ncbi:MAG: polysaccharide export protein [Deltaproteobacteria bacterium]|nr:polysaccharide export protein [Deltaproteobacteria bacterium]
MSKVGLGPGDVFEVTVYGEEKLSRTLRVSPEGDVHFPLIGRLDIAGLTTTEIEDLIRTKLQDGYIRDPSVTVYVKEYNSKKVFVLGEVKNPGTFPFAAGMSIVEAISLAGGFLESANTNYVVVTRRTAEGEQRIPIPVEKITQGLAANFSLQPGDIIYIPDTLL